MQTEHLIIRPLLLKDLGGAMRLSTEQGWNQTEKDWRFMIENPQNLCLLVDYHGKIIATTTAINYSGDVVWISMVLVDKDYRGHGISKLLLENMLKKLSFCNSIKLDATPEGQRVYKGFKFIDEYVITRMTSEVVNTSHLLDEDDSLHAIQKEDIAAVVAYDTFSFGADRSVLIGSLIKTHPHQAWMMKHHDAVAGFVLGRAGRKYNQIGPVMAASTTHAKILISKLLRQSEHKPIVVDVLNDKSELIAWLTSIGFIQQRQFVRMYLRDNPFPGNVDHQYLICGPEFG